VLASILDPLYQAMGWVLATIYGFVPNYIVAIMGLTLLVLALLTPLTLKGMRSQITIQKPAPEVKRLQAEYKDDRMAMNEAVMALYKEHGANPISGCLPFLVQSPFFFALFGVLRGIANVEYRTPVEGQGFRTWVAHKTFQQGDVKIGVPKHIPTGSKLYRGLFGTNDSVPAASGLRHLSHQAGELKVWGFDLAQSASKTVSKGFGTFLPYLALIVAMIALQVYAQQQITKRNPQAAAANPQMQMMNKVFPFLFGIWGWAFQAGLTLYWTTSAALRIVQQSALYRFDPKLAESVRERRAAFEREVKTAVDPKGDKQAKAQKPPPERMLKPAAQAVGAGKPSAAAPKSNPGRQQPKKRRKGR
jgi:YidC/Oxa1 family membrane protein insertase